jgi:hypothetical protein
MINKNEERRTVGTDVYRVRYKPDGNAVLFLSSEGGRGSFMKCYAKILTAKRRAVSVPDRVKNAASII